VRRSSSRTPPARSLLPTVVGSLLPVVGDAVVPASVSFSEGTALSVVTGIPCLLEPSTVDIF
jgi:hypothetical protein